jgi:cell division transport system permease protein
MRLRLVLSEAFRSIGANVSTTVAATLTVLISMFVLGLVIALGSWVSGLTESAKDKLLVKVYFCTPLTCGQEPSEAQKSAAGVLIRRMPEVEWAKFVSKADALKIMERRAPELVEGLSSNPLPDAFEIKPRRGEDARVIANRLRASLPPGVERIRDGEKTADRILYVARVAWIVSIFFVIVLGIAAAMLIANTIRLSIFARRREIEVMKLVGATNWFVRGPFMIEGIVCGLAGTAIALMLLLLGKELAAPLILDESREVETISFIWNAAILVAVGLLLGAAGSALTLRRFLRI